MGLCSLWIRNRKLVIIKMRSPQSHMCNIEMQKTLHFSSASNIKTMHCGFWLSQMKLEEWECAEPKCSQGCQEESVRKWDVPGPCQGLCCKSAHPRSHRARMRNAHLSLGNTADDLRAKWDSAARRCWRSKDVEMEWQEDGIKGLRLASELMLGTLSSLMCSLAHTLHRGLDLGR